MAWSTIRKATDYDLMILRERFEHFIGRHSEIWVDPNEMTDNFNYSLNGELTCYIRDDPYGTKRQKLSRLWARIRSNALGVNCDGIAHGYVGRSVD